MTAYIVPSIFLGQSLQASTSKGMVFSSPTTYKITESPRQNTLSGMPNWTFYLVTSNNWEKPRILQPNAVVTNYFLKSTNFKNLLYIIMPSIEATA